MLAHFMADIVQGVDNGRNALRIVILSHSD
jgi:hypothetical protein